MLSHPHGPCAASLSVFPRLLALPPQESFLSLELPDKFNRNFQSMKTLIDFYLQGEVGMLGLHGAL